MVLTRSVLVVFASLLILTSSTDARKRKARRFKRNHMTCRPRSLVRYQMTVHTTWDKETFPKMFPTYRPPAHWSQLIGRSHGNGYKMWQEGSNASLAVQKFAEKENAEIFDLELSQGYNGVLDAFVAPKIETSVGQTSAVVSLDGRHSKVSFMMKIVPSPDWFIGLDSAELCYRGRWRKSYSRDLRPFDAGTDQGLTFTSPKWSNIPKEPISAITSSTPDHPASSFFYPEYKVLPRLAHVEFEMISEYRLRKVHKKIIPIPQQNTSGKNSTTTSDRPEDDVFKNSEDDSIDAKLASLKKNDKSSEHLAANNHKEADSNTKSLFSLISASRRELSTDKPQKQGNAPTQQTRFSQNHTETAHQMRSLSFQQTNSRRNPERTSTPLSRQEKLEGLTTTTEESLKQQQVQSDSHLREACEPERLSTKRLQDYQKRVDCKVSEWSEWSACSQTCGFGNKQRFREVKVPPRQGGAYCPLLREETLCGSMRNCQWKHFSLISRKVKSPLNTMKQRMVRRRRKH